MTILAILGRFVVVNSLPLANLPAFALVSLNGTSAQVGSSMLSQNIDMYIQRHCCSHGTGTSPVVCNHCFGEDATSHMYTKCTRIVPPITCIPSHDILYEPKTVSVSSPRDCCILIGRVGLLHGRVTSISLLKSTTASSRLWQLPLMPATLEQQSCSGIFLQLLIISRTVLQVWASQIPQALVTWGRLSIQI